MKKKHNEASRRNIFHSSFLGDFLRIFHIVMKSTHPKMPTEKNREKKSSLKLQNIHRNFFLLLFLLFYSIFYWFHFIFVEKEKKGSKCFMLIWIECEFCTWFLFKWLAYKEVKYTLLFIEKISGMCGKKYHTNEMCVW